MQVCVVGGCGCWGWDVCDSGWGGVCVILGLKAGLRAGGAGTGCIGRDTESSLP